VAQVASAPHCEYHTEENFGGKKLWWIWRISSNSTKFFLPKDLITHCSILGVTICHVNCGMSFWKQFKRVTECRLFCVILLKVYCVCLGVLHPLIDCIRVPLKGASISEIVMCSYFALGFTLFSTHTGCILILPHLHLVDCWHTLAFVQLNHKSFFPVNFV